MAGTVVDQLYQEFLDLVSHLEKGQQVSLRSVVDDNFRKALLLAAASYFERKLTDELVAFFHETSNGHPLVVAFLKNKGLNRQYHTLFDWEAQNANRFYGLFGEEFAEFMKSKASIDKEFVDGVTAFLEIGRERNRLVHQDYGSFVLEKTAKEIYDLYQQASTFLEKLPVSLRGYGLAPNQGQS